jgi:hypothetical protein
MSSYSSISPQTAVKCGQSALLSFRPRPYHLQHRSICCQAKGFGSSEPKPAKGKAGKQKSAEPRRSSKQKAPKQKPAPAPTPASAAEADVIDVEGSVVDMRIPVTVSSLALLCTDTDSHHLLSVPEAISYFIAQLNAHVGKAPVYMPSHRSLLDSLALAKLPY